MTNPTDRNSEYRAPISSPDSGRPDWLPSQVGTAIFGKSYVDEANPSWEEVITMVVIPGQPDAIRNASGQWEVLFSRLDEARSMVDQEVQRLQTWEGAAGDTYRQHLTEIGQKISSLVQQHKPVVQQLNTSAENLQNALENTPIPDDMVDDVMRARADYARSGQINTNEWSPGAIFDKMFPIMSNRWVSEAVNFITGGFADWVSDKLRDWITSEDDKAKAAYHQLAGQHVSTMDSMPQGYHMLSGEAYTRTVTPGQPAGATTPGSAGTPSGYDTTLAGAGGGPGGPGAGGFGGPGGTGIAGNNPGQGLYNPGGGLAGGGPGGGGGAGGVPAGGMPGSTSAANAGRGVGGMGMGGMPMGGGMGGAGAAGAGGSGARGGSPKLNVPSSTTAGGAGGGMGGGRGGMGGMPMGGMGAGAAGAGAAGARGAGSGGKPGGVPGGVAGGTGAGGKGAGAGGRMGMGGMPMGAGGGHGAGGEGSDHSTWLNEDEDVWGTDSDAPPPVLGG